MFTPGFVQVVSCRHQPSGRADEARHVSWQCSVSLHPRVGCCWGCGGCRQEREEVQGKIHSCVCMCVCVPYPFIHSSLIHSLCHSLSSSIYAWNAVCSSCYTSASDVRLSRKVTGCTVLAMCPEGMRSTWCRRSARLDISGTSWPLLRAPPWGYPTIQLTMQ